MEKVGKIRWQSSSDMLDYCVMLDQVILWGGFNLFVLAMLVIDLGVFHRKLHEISLQEALFWSVFWVVLALLFNVGIYYWRGEGAALEFLTGYLIERSLSFDNLFVFVVIFSYFGLAAKYQHKVLFWGILGALIMRGIFIVGGVALIRHVHWVIYIFGSFLVLMGLKMIFKKEEEEINLEKNVALRFLRKFVPIMSHYQGEKFLVKEGKKKFATPLLVALLVVEVSDLIFAMDSIPAILAITKNPFIVYTSNVFAILGLRALYFVIERIMQLFNWLHVGLSIILIFIGIKMLLEKIYEIPIGVSLLVVMGLLVLSIVASLIWPKKKIA